MTTQVLAIVQKYFNYKLGVLALTFLCVLWQFLKPETLFVIAGCLFCIANKAFGRQLRGVDWGGHVKGC